MYGYSVQFITIRRTLNQLMTYVNHFIKTLINSQRLTVMVDDIALSGRYQSIDHNVIRVTLSVALVYCLFSIIQLYNTVISTI